jgi:hypothetical protein
MSQCFRTVHPRGFAVLIGRWRALRHFTVSPSKIGDIVKAHSYSPISDTAESTESQ